MRETCGFPTYSAASAALSASGNSAHYQSPSLSPSIHSEKSKVQPLIERRRDFNTMCNTLILRIEAKTYIVEHLMPKGRTKSGHGGQPLQVCIIWSKGSREAFLYHSSGESKNE